MELNEGGSKLSVDGELKFSAPEAEYPALYRRFAEITKAGTSDVDLAPLRHVADAFMLGKRKVVDAFYD
jgi:D-galactose 1-dehydrogenase